MAREGRKSLSFPASCAFAGAVLAFFVSCAGAPKAVQPSPDRPFSRLGAGASAYATADVAALRPLLETVAPKLGNDRRLAALLDATRTASIAFFPGPGARFRLEARGDYPRFRSWLSLTFSGDWRWTGGSKPYWRSKSGLSLAFVDSGAVIVSDGSPWAEGGPPTIPAAFDTLSQTADLRSWVADPASVLTRLPSPVGSALRLPLQELAFSLEREGDGYAVEIVAAVAGEREAKSLAAAFRFARNLVSAGAPLQGLAGKLLRSDLVADGSFLRMRVDGMDAAEIFSLLPPLDGALLGH